MNWVSNAKRVGELCAISSSKRIHAREYQEVGVPFYRGKEIIEKHRGALSVSVEKFISEDRFCKIERNHGAPRQGDLLLTSVGTLGVPYVVKPGERFYFKDGNLTWFREFDGLDVGFLYYWILSPWGKEQLKRFTIGSSQPALTIAGLKDMEIELPPLPTQKHIAAILSAYDDLIENNTRRIAIVEGMARRLYEEWFVHFRFPGHEEAEFEVEGDQQLPRGWNAKEVKELVKRQKNGVVYKQVDVATTGEAIVIDQSRAEYLGFHDNIADHDASAVSPFIIFGDHTCKMQIVVTPFSLGPNTIAFTSATGVPLYYLYALIQGSVTTREYKRHWGDLMKKKVVVANNELAGRYNETVMPMFSFIETIRRANRNLRAQRDLLLPKLVSGDIDVTSANAELEAVE